MLRIFVGIDIMIHIGTERKSTWRLKRINTHITRIGEVYTTSDCTFSRVRIIIYEIRKWTGI